MRYSSDPDFADPKPPTQIPPGDLADAVGDHEESDFDDEEGEEDEEEE